MRSPSAEAARRASRPAPSRATPPLCRAGHGRAGHGRAGDGRAGHGRTRPAGAPRASHRRCVWPERARSLNPSRPSVPLHHAQRMLAMCSHVQHGSGRGRLPYRPAYPETPPHPPAGIFSAWPALTIYPERPRGRHRSTTVHGGVWATSPGMQNIR